MLNTKYETRTVLKYELDHSGLSNKMCIFKHI